MPRRLLVVRLPRLHGSEAGDLDLPRDGLLDLDIAGEYLKGILIESSNPPFSQSEHLPFGGWISYSYNLALPPGKEISVTLFAHAAQQGDYSGEFGFCINNMHSCLYYPVRTIVE